ncbi:disks large-associated protein 5 isoform X3 [Erythrolamprus reginae]|uniref:disks large-associated protein 5 isoform X3 n=1 Tax=Erythrolamprus reginae TaxID=121349 RepID=UPI00396C6F45
MATNFSSRYKKDLSIDALRTKLVLQKCIIQKENRHKEFNKGRQFGQVDANQPSKDDAPSQLGKRSKACAPKPNVAKTREQERLKMLHRYKSEKELRRLKEQREKPVFKCGQFKPETPAFLTKLSHIPVSNKSKEKEAPVVMRMTRSKTKQLPEPTKAQLSSVASSYTSKVCSRQVAQQEQKQIYIDKPSKKENKEVQSAIPKITHGRMTRAKVAAMSRIPQASKPSIISGNLPEKRVKIKEKPQKVIGKENMTQVAYHTDQDILMEQKKEVLVPQLAESSEQKAFLDKQNLSATRKRSRSFAPPNFVFQAPKSLSNYKVKPMTPSSADEFLSPNLFWSPLEKTNSKVYKEETQDCDPQLSSNPEVTKQTTEGHQCALNLLEELKEERVPNEMGDNIAFEGESSVRPTTTLQDVPYFRNILQSETERLTSFCLEWDKSIEMDIPEEAKDLVRTTIGQTRLLMAERFKQFEGLINNCEFKSGEKETTCTDLLGFWEMVNFQVEDITKKFENLKKHEANGWQMVDDVQPHKPAKKKPILRRTVKAAEGSAESGAARKRLATVKAAMKNKAKEGLAAQAAGQGAERIFDGGFFRIESPAKPFPGVTPKSAVRNSQYTTPRSANKALLQNCREICILKQGTSSTSKAIPPFPDPASTHHLGFTSEQSGEQATEELCARTSEAEIKTVEEATSCDRSTSSSDMDVFQFKEEALEIGGEMKQTSTDQQVKQVFLTPTENTPAAETCDQVQHIPERSSCDDEVFEPQPNLDISIFFTPLRNNAEKHISVDSSRNLIEFSPFPEMKK